MEHTLRLSEVDSGATVVLVSMEGGRDFLSRLAALGFIPETRLQVVQNRGRGPMIVSLRDTRIALGRGESSKILVSLAGEES